MRSYALVQWMQGYFLLMAVGFTAYMVRAVRQYGRWLRDNYADLEHKEVWQSLLVLAVIILLFCYYVVGYGSITYEFIVQVCGIALVAYLLWRVETLQDLSFQPMADGDIALAEAQRAAAEAAEADDEADDDTLDGDGGRPQPAEGLSEAVIQEIGKLLHDRCEGNKFYLQTDLTSVQLAQALGTRALPPGVGRRRGPVHPGQAAGQPQWLPQLPHLQRSLQAAHRPERKRLDRRARVRPASQ